MKLPELGMEYGPSSMAGANIDPWGRIHLDVYSLDLHQIWSPGNGRNQKKHGVKSHILPGGGKF